ncbi:hypothetical protein AB0L42_37490 [Streptomyces sp. NPDC052287]
MEAASSGLDIVAALAQPLTMEPTRVGKCISASIALDATTT